MLTRDQRKLSWAEIAAYRPEHYSGTAPLGRACWTMRHA